MPRRVLLTTDAVGGVWRYVTVLAHGLAARGVEPIIAALGPPPSPSQRAEVDCRVVSTGLPLDWTAADEASLAAAAGMLADLAASVGADIAHLHAPAFAASTRWRVPVVAVAHSCLATWWHAVRGSVLPDDFAWRVAITGRGLSAADAVIAPSMAFADALDAAYDSLTAIIAIHNGLPGTPVLRGTRERAVLSAGRLWDDAKNLAALDEAAQHLDAPVYAAGPLGGPNGATACLPHLRLLGELDARALGTRYAAATVFAAPALYEPFGLSVLEAAQAGMALVLADIPSFRELWDGAALFVDPRDAVALADALARALAAPAALAAAASARARDYTADRMTQRTLAVHRAVLARRAVAA